MVDENDVDARGTSRERRAKETIAGGDVMDGAPGADNCKCFPVSDLSEARAIAGPPALEISTCRQSHGALKAIGGSKRL